MLIPALSRAAAVCSLILAGTAAAAPPAPRCAFQDEKQFCACLGLSCGGDTVPDKDGVYHSIYCGTCDAARVCVGKPTFAGGAAGVCAAIGGLDPAQKKVAEQLTSLWENSTPELAYGYSEDIKDGRGYTSGRAGFCTGTGDAVVVAACYNQVKPGNALQKYWPALVALEQRFVKSGGKQNQASTAGLEGWPEAWKAASEDPAFRRCQDGAVDAVYYGAAMQHAAAKGFRTALTRAAFYDAQINMGDDNPRYGMRAMIARADKATGPIGSPPTHEEEMKWLGHFLRIRAQIMFADKHTWRSNMYRVATYEKLRQGGNHALAGCIKTGVSAGAAWPDSNFTRDRGPSAKVGACN